MSANGAKVVVVDGGYDNYDQERAVLAPLGAQLVVSPCAGDPERVAAAAHDADAVMVRETQLPRETLERLDRLRVIVRYGVGTDNIDLACARNRGIAVANVPDYGVDEVSEHALALLLAVKRRLLERDAALRAGALGRCVRHSRLPHPRWHAGSHRSGAHRARLSGEGETAWI